MIECNELQIMTYKIVTRTFSDHLFQKKCFLLMSLDGLIYPHLIEQSRSKAGTIWTTIGNVKNLADLRKALSTGLSIGAN